MEMMILFAKIKTGLRPARSVPLRKNFLPK